MRVPLSWLREYTDCSLSADDLAERLTLSGLEVEGIDRIGVFSRNVVLARIVSTEAHPKAANLRVVRLDLGEDQEAIALTAAPNVAEGLTDVLVATALPDAIIIDAKSESFDVTTVARREVMGLDSSAVLCSEKELGLSSEHEGVLIWEQIPKDAKFLKKSKKAPRAGDQLLDHVIVGAEIAADEVLDIAILPNYGRCLSMIGMAREIAALTRTSFQLEVSAEYLPSEEDSFDINIADPDLCSRYTGFLIEGVTVKPSPDWMQRRLVLTGHKPINCLVDVTNYVMEEFGQPLHAFDVDRLPAREITVRRARAGETIFTLDQEKGNDETPGDSPRALNEDTLLITSGGKAVAVAGVMGGLDSQIHSDTKNILLESANFDAVSVRKTTAQLKINSDSSYRFSREVDPSLTTVAIQRSAHLLKEAADATITGALRDVHPRPAPRRTLDVTPQEISRCLGVDVSADEIVSALNRLGFTASDEGDRVHIEIPGFRQDVSIPVDIAEEVIRVMGFDRLPPKRLAEPLPRQRKNASWEIRETLRDVLAGAGLQDVITYSLTSPEVEKRLLAAENSPPDDPYVTIMNPGNQERSSMRRTLLAGLMEIVARNHRHRERIALFEIGHVWHPEHGEGLLPAEPHHLGIVLSGPIDEANWDEGSPRDVHFFDLKGLIESLVEKLHIPDVKFARSVKAPFHPGIAASVECSEETLGTLGQIHPAVIESFDLGDRRVVAAEIDLEPWIRDARTQYKFQSFSRFPPVVQDLNLIVEEKVAAQDVEDVLSDSAGPLLTDLHLLNLYRGEQIGEGMKSLSFRLTFCALDRSLAEDEINKIREEILPILEKKVGATIR